MKSVKQMVGSQRGSQIIDKPSGAPGPWKALTEPLFRSLWIATIISNVGTWIHEVGASWLMVVIDPSPLKVALVQTAASLPMFLLALPSGALADIVDRRRLLIYSQIWMLASAAALAASTYFQTLQRVTISDSQIQEAIRRFQVDHDCPIAAHFVVEPVHNR